MGTAETNIKSLEYLPDRDYTYTFGDLTDKLKTGRVQVVKHHSRRFALQQYNMHVAVEDGQLLKRHLDYMPPEIADCIDIAAAVSIADKLSVRSVRKRARIHVILPVRSPDFWNSYNVVAELEAILYWFTRDNWTFEFVQRLSDPRSSELQPRLPMHSDKDTYEDACHLSNVEVALWSGGLDSYAGLCNRIQDNPERIFTLFGTGSNDKTQHLQQKLVTKLNDTLEVKASVNGGTASRLKLVQVPIRMARGENLPIKTIHRSSGQRSRGFVFMLLGAACAYLEGQRDLYIYENGTGAFNLPYRASETARDHAVPVHPLSLLRMGRLISLVIGEPFTFYNPFLLWTKAEMCEAIAEPEMSKLIWETVSCDRPRRERPGQCGCCSSCLLRRQALLTLHIEDRTQYGVLSEMKEIEDAGSYQSRNPRRPFKKSHLQAMRQQVNSLRAILQSDNPWISLVSRPGYALLEQTVEETAPEVSDGVGGMPVTPDQILRLYQKFVSEWRDDVQQELGKGLLSSTILYAIDPNSDVTSRKHEYEKPGDLHTMVLLLPGTEDDPHQYKQMDIEEYIERSTHAT